MKPIIGITGNETRKTDTAFLDTSVLRTFASKSLSQIVIDKGGLPLIMPIAVPDLATDYIDQIDKLIITGGQNVSPSLYGQEQTIKSTDYHLQRDLFEVALIQEAMAQGKPIFGICRGLQIINVALGGSLLQDIPNHWQAERNEERTQEIEIEPISDLAFIYSSKTKVNTFHRQAIDRLGKGLTVVARDRKDQTIEAIIGKHHPILGVQWHPELLMPSSPEDEKLFEFVLQSL